MTNWSDIVTTALLGTGRRPMPTDVPGWAGAAGLSDGADAEGRVLDLAAAHRVAAQAGRRPEAGGAPAPGATAAPPQRLPLAPPGARRLLDAFLLHPDSTTVGSWLSACRRQGRGLAPEHWARIAELAARSTAYDRGSLSAVLGERGRWFVGQNPGWQKLALVLDTCAEEDADPLDIGTALDLPTTEQVEHDPELLMAIAAPWPDTLVAAAIVGLVGGRMGNKQRSYARVLGAGLSLVQYASLAALARRFLELPQLTPAARRGVRNLFVEIERATYDRIEVERAFDPSLARIAKITIPPV